MLTDNCITDIVSVVVKVVIRRTDTRDSLLAQDVGDPTLAVPLTVSAEKNLIRGGASIIQALPEEGIIVCNADVSNCVGKCFEYEDCEVHLSGIGCHNSTRV